jgi:hypothetical protein
LSTENTNKTHLILSNKAKTPSAGPRQRFPEFPSMSSAAGALGVSLSVLRDAKRLGAPGFLPSGRIASGPLLAWALTDGRESKPGRSLEAARARLADAQATKLEKQEQLERGLLVPVLWARDAVAQRLEQPRAWFRERVPRLAFLVATVAGIPDQKRREAEVLRFLNGDADEILKMVGHAESWIDSDFAKGPPDGPERTALGDLERMCDRMMEEISAPARDEIRGFVKRLRDEREAESANNPEADPTPKEATEAKCSTMTI